HPARRDRPSGLSADNARGLKRSRRRARLLRRLARTHAETHSRANCVPGLRQIPALLLGDEMSASGLGDRVEARLPIVLRNPPAASYEPSLLETHHTRV